MSAEFLLMSVIIKQKALIKLDGIEKPYTIELY